MVLVSYSGREINAKLVYYGPGLSGKTTNLEYIYSSIPQGQRGKMVSMKTKTERTLFFDFLPVHLGELSGFKTRFLLYTVPGQVYYNATRKLVLKGVDAVVFVADSKRGKMDENVESLDNLKENLKDLGLTLDKLPWVIQYNKRDLSDIYTLEELEAVLNPGRAPAYEGVASTGVGVVETFKGISRLLLRKLAKDVGVPVVGSTVEAEATQPPSAAGSASPAVEAAPVALRQVAEQPVPEDRAAAFPAPAVPDGPVTVYATAPVEAAWPTPAPAVRDVPVAEYEPDAPWTARADTSPLAFQCGTGVPAGSEDREIPREPEAAVIAPSSQFPPVAEPVRIPRSGSIEPSGWGTRSDSEEPSEHRVSVGERLRRWLSRAPEPDAAGDPCANAEEAAESAPVPALVAEAAATPAPLLQPESDLLPPASEFVACAEPVTEFAMGRSAGLAVERVAEPAAGPLAGSAVEPVAELTEPVAGPAVEPLVETAVELLAEFAEEPMAERPMAPVAEAVLGRVTEPTVRVPEASDTSRPTLVAEPLTVSRPLMSEAASSEMATEQAGASITSVPSPPVAVGVPVLVASGPSPARETQPPPRRRRPREIIVPLELSPDDLAEGVVVKVAIRVQQIASDTDDEADQYAA